MSENVPKTLTPIISHDGATDSYDHEIDLVDSTNSGKLSSPANEPRSDSPSPSTKDLARKGTRESVIGQLSRQKYVKYQQHRYDSTKGGVVSGEYSSSRPVSAPQAEVVNGEPKTHAVDYAPSAPATAPVETARKNVDKRRRESKRLKEEVSEIDILYENQRGSFFCGIPLYAHSSLLPTDPSPWTNKAFKDSPVNITNAQVPDPSWEWTWKNWYVDMSHDVDEEGWEYSFAFGRTWVWHGTHPWFHSFVRRRRWLRKRVKREFGRGLGKGDSVSNAHNLTGDYFTIHSKRDRSPIDAADGIVKTARPSSYISYPSSLDPDEPPEDVKDIASLLRTLKFATIDREKIEALKKFVTLGGEELVYLQDHIPEIMSFLVFQTSKTQLLAYLQKTANDARQHRQNHENEQRPAGEAESQRIDHLLAAVKAANAEIGGLEYWSDRKHVLKTTDSEDSTTQQITTIFDQPLAKPKVDNDPVQEIKGISDKADIRVDNKKSVLNPARQLSSNQQEEKDQKEDKGKGRAYDSEDDQVEQTTSQRSGPDDVFVPTSEN